MLFIPKRNYAWRAYVSQEFQPVWIWVHVPLAFAAFIGGILGVIFGGKLPDDPGFVDSVYNAHKVWSKVLVVDASSQCWLEVYLISAFGLLSGA